MWPVDKEGRGVVVDTGRSASDRLWTRVNRQRVPVSHEWPRVDCDHECTQMGCESRMGTCSAAAPWPLGFYRITSATAISVSDKPTQPTRGRVRGMLWVVLGLSAGCDMRTFALSIPTKPVRLGDARCLFEHANDNVSRQPSAVSPWAHVSNHHPHSPVSPFRSPSESSDPSPARATVCTVRSDPLISFDHSRIPRVTCDRHRDAGKKNTPQKQNAIGHRRTHLVSLPASDGSVTTTSECGTCFWFWFCLGVASGCEQENRLDGKRCSLGVGRRGGPRPPRRGRRPRDTARGAAGGGKGGKGNEC